MKKILFSLMAVAALTACNNVDDFPPLNPSDSDVIKVNASIDYMTRVETDGMASHFENDDRIMVYGWTGDKTVVPANPPIESVNTLKIENNVETWNAAPQMLWQSQTAAHYFIGIYPVRPVTNFSSDAYLLDETKQEDADLLVAVSDDQGIVANNRGVDLVFKHMMAKVNINMNFRSQFGDVSPVPSEVKLYCGKEAAVNYLLQRVTADAYIFDATKYIDMPVQGTPVTGFDKSYSSIVVPQTGVNMVDIVIDGTTYRYEGVEDIPFTTGKVTTLNLNVGKDEITLAGVTVGDWQDGETIGDGEAEEVITYNLATQTENMAITSDCVIDGSSLTTAYTKQITITGDVEVILKNVNQIASGDNKDAITINGDVTLNIEGENTINVSTNYTDAIRVNSGSLTINGNSDDKLIIDGSQNRCGAIVLANGADLIINGGYIDVKAGSWHAGIGGGYGSSDYPEDNTPCGTITINGGNISAQGGYYAPGIGATYSMSGGDIIITGGTITAKGGNTGAGIGTGYLGTCGNITISGASTSITAVGDGPGGGVSIGAEYQGTCGTVTIGAGVTVNGTTYNKETVGEIENNN